MLKLCWFEFRNKISASINWERRRVYEKWEKVIVTSENKLMLMRLGATLISERDVDFDDIFTVFENNETPTISEEEVNALIQEKEVLKTQVNELNLKVEELEESLKNVETLVPTTQEEEVQVEEIPTTQEETIIQETLETQEEVEVIQLNKTQIIEELTRLWVDFNKNDLKENLAKLLEDTLNAVDETETPKGE